jgi:transcriptional regulator with XRE-family HTH domain
VGVKTPGQKLRDLRLAKRLTMSDVQALTEEVARSRHNPRFRVSKTRLCGIEIQGRTPSIYCLHALASVYETDLRTLLRFYGCA